jgi:hypothetical protein
MAAAEETKLLEAAIQSPTSFNMQNWRFVMVRDAEGRSTGPVGSRGARPLRVIDRLAEPGNTGVGFRWWPE